MPPIQLLSRFYRPLATRIARYLSVTAAAEALPSFFDLERPQLQRLIDSLGWPAYRAQQLWTAFYDHGVAELSDIRVLSAVHRAELEKHLRFDSARVSHEAVSSDGTIKLLVECPSKPSQVEVVFIPDGTRGTLCVSSQAGCSLSCTFCHTGTQKLQRNLSAGDIVCQVLAARQVLRRKRGEATLASKTGASLSEHTQISSLDTTSTINRLVFMGQGEPGYNPRAVLSALRILSAGYAAPLRTTPLHAASDEGVSRVVGSRSIHQHLAPHHITVSTAGVAPFIVKLGQEAAPFRLAVSLHAPSDVLRSAIMPINNVYPLDVVMSACAEYVMSRIKVVDGTATSEATPEKYSPMLREKVARWFEAYAERHNSQRRIRISFEYVLLQGVNDSLLCARELAALLLKYLPSQACHVNLLHFNSWPGSPYLPTSLAAALQFQRELQTSGIVVTLRKSRGSDVLGACGQLKSSKESKQVRQLL